MNRRVCFKGKRSLIERREFFVVHADFVYSVDNKSGTSSNIWLECFSSVGGDTDRVFGTTAGTLVFEKFNFERSIFYSRYSLNAIRSSTDRV